jgi:uncharacterized membrane protein
MAKKTKNKMVLITWETKAWVLISAVLYLLGAVGSIPVVAILYKPKKLSTNWNKITIVINVTAMIAKTQLRLVFLIFGLNNNPPIAIAKNMKTNVPTQFVIKFDKL